MIHCTKQCFFFFYWASAHFIYSHPFIWWEIWWHHTSLFRCVKTDDQHFSLGCQISYTAHKYVSLSDLNEHAQPYRGVSWRLQWESARPGLCGTAPSTTAQHIIVVKNRVFACVVQHCRHLWNCVIIWDVVVSAVCFSLLFWAQVGFCSLWGGVSFQRWSMDTCTPSGNQATASQLFFFSSSALTLFSPCFQCTSLFTWFLQRSCLDAHHLHSLSVTWYLCIQHPLADLLGGWSQRD